jgi:hypothetical protein
MEVGKISFSTKKSGFRFTVDWTLGMVTRSDHWLGSLAAEINEFYFSIRLHSAKRGVPLLDRKSGVKVHLHGRSLSDSNRTCIDTLGGSTIKCITL